ncbi:proline--tRNA ligase [Malassezia caprae]|uniref:proline--tRNA ligase n=1 Tax=Malassezia caprae TaxID=1381934 RepID=A0AAF0E6C3_9BASI|nr:proline--tRNA ligase [Malassezia caprae]
MGLRMLNKITTIIEDEMDALFRFKDRRSVEMILAPTHEEEVTKLIGAEIDSVKSLPVRVYQIGRKFRDEPRPRAGLLRTKEFLMKDLSKCNSM